MGQEKEVPVPNVEPDKTKTPKYFGAIQVTYYRDGTVSMLATPNLRVELENGLESTSRLFSDGTYVTLKGTGVTVIRSQKFTEHFQNQVSVAMKEEEVMIQVHTGIRTTFYHK